MLYNVIVIVQPTPKKDRKTGVRGGARSRAHLFFMISSCFWDGEGFGLSSTMGL
jgi:hypothetical protein